MKASKSSNNRAIIIMIKLGFFFRLLKATFNIDNELNLYKCLTVSGHMIDHKKMVLIKGKGKSQEPERLYIFNEYENLTFAGKIPPLPNPPIFFSFLQGFSQFSYLKLFSQKLPKLMRGSCSYFFTYILTSYNVQGQSRK